ncbi:MAG: prevent-host-death protein [Oscillospiraceae bacterium]|nr:prevent-host-death protein [Oscillospiraceae bacterium]
MPNIKPVSDLRNYNEVLKDISVGEPVFLTKNGRGRYAILDLDDYEKTYATLQLLTELQSGRTSGLRDGYSSLDEVEARLGISHD